MATDDKKQKKLIVKNTVNLERVFGPRVKYSADMQCLTSMAYNIRVKARELGFDLYLFNDSEILAMGLEADEEWFGDLLNNL